MKNYEGIFIVGPELKEEEAKSAFKTITDTVIKNGGTIKKEEAWGKRELAYKVKKFKEGYYYKLDFDIPPSAVSKLEASYKLNANILRTLITRK